jgi:hypothetical protein
MRLDSIENILDDFDFHRVQQVMIALDWKWATAVDGVPYVGELRKQARSLLEDVYRYEDTACITMGCGGFEATRLMEVGSLTKYLSIKFVVEERNNHE